MPALSQNSIDDIRERLNRFLHSRGGADEVTFLDAGGSAAVFQVTRGSKRTAFKGFDPALFEGPGGDADRRRLAVQRRLIGHTCPTLVQTFTAQEAEGTAFIEMEFVEWPQLAKCLSNVPDDAVASLISQLVEAVRYLESLSIVHRDIKPENIHVSPDFRKLLLLDLGVARDFEAGEEDVAVTDVGSRRPFLATAQYSSPEYLFRLDEPTSKLWRGLNFYQVGAVLHDLIKKECLFHHEMSLGNRWLVARAVLIKQPAFVDETANRLPALKALALKCLTKDLDTRLSLVRWEDFLVENNGDPLMSLRDRLSKGVRHLDYQANNNAAARLEFDRNDYLRRLTERTRAELISICGANLPSSMHSPDAKEELNYRFVFSAAPSISIACIVNFQWQSELYERKAGISVGAQLVYVGGTNPSPIKFTLLGVFDLDVPEDDAAQALAREVARRVGLGLDRIEAAGGSAENLHGVDI